MTTINHYVFYKDTKEEINGLEFTGTLAECKKEMKRIKTQWKKEDWRKAGQTEGYTNEFLTRTFRIEK